MKKTAELITHPLWMLPVFMLSFLIFVEALHTTAHLHQEIDVHGTCRQNKEYIEMIENESEDW